MTSEESNMQRTRFYFLRGTRRGCKEDERGVALLTALLLLMLLTGLGVAMVISVRSDLMINGYYREFRGSFYAADSGLNIARRAMVNQIIADEGTLGAGYNPSTTPPLSTSEDSAITSLINTAYGAGYTSINKGNAANSWPGQFKITSATFTFAQCTPIGSTGTCSAPTTPATVTGYNYQYNYALTAVGQASTAVGAFQSSQATTLTDAGSIFVTALGTPGSYSTSFAAWGMFINSYNICDGSSLVPGTISGPVFTNGSWNIGTGGKYIFTDSVGSAGADAGYQFSNGCDKVAGPSDKKGNTPIAPNFQQGFNLKQPAVPLPPNDFNQARAVLDSEGASNTAVSKQDLNNNVRNASKTPYPMNGANGVYLPYSVNAQGNATFTGGGIYVQGDASVQLSTSGAAQVYTITQNGTTSTVTINNSTNTTVFTTGGTTVNISGVPIMKDPATGNVLGDATMLYVNGNITSLKGPGQGVPAINDGTALTVTASGNVNITGDILYKTEPVTLTQTTNAQGQTVPADSLIQGNNNGQSLGIFTATGNINLQNGQANGNLEIDASLASISQGGSGGLTNTGNAINTLTIVGGRIQNTIQNINTTTRNVFFDRRYSQGFSPPWFPSTTVTNKAGSGVTFPVPSVSRTQWVNQSSYN